MKTRDLLHVGVCPLEPLQVVYKTCLFGTAVPRSHYDKRIRQTFQQLREWSAGFGLDPSDLRYIGIPTLEDQQLVLYDCCIEFPLPVVEVGADVALRILPGGLYAILRVEKKPAQIGKAIQRFRVEYLWENRLVSDEKRPVYEIYYPDTMEYCVPILR